MSTWGIRPDTEAPVVWSGGRTLTDAAAVRSSLAGIPIYQSWLVPKRGSLLVGAAGSDELWMHPYAVQRMILDHEHRAMLRRLFSPELLAAAGVKA